MKNKALLPLVASFLTVSSTWAADIGTAFSYQGSLARGGSPVGTPAPVTCDFRFGLWDAALLGNQKGDSPQTVLDITVDNGLFNLGSPNINFGSNAFDGTARWLAIEVLCPGDVDFTLLTPRVELTPVPHALALPGLYTQQNATSPNLIAGHSGNSVTTAVSGAVIDGGGAAASTNRVTDNFGSVGGGSNNRAGDNAGTTSDAQHATVGGGQGNVASGSFSMVPGGTSCTADGDRSFAAGTRAKANHYGSFVWADGTNADFTSTDNDQFLIRASGGVGIGTASPDVPLHVASGPTATLDSGTGAMVLGAINSFNIVMDDELIQARHNGVGSKLYLNHWAGDMALVAGNPDGRVGVGTSQPQTRLHVYLLGEADLSDNSGGLAIGSVSQNNLVMDGNEIQARDDGAAADLILNEHGGSVGIGISTPDTLLHVDSDSFATLDSGTGSVVIGRTNSANIVMDASIIQSRNNGVARLLMLNPYGGNVLVGGFTEGNMGIGTTIPDARLHVDGGVEATLAHGTGNAVIGSISGWHLALDGNEIQARNNLSASDLMLNEDGGDVGIGVSFFADARLHVDNGTEATLVDTTGFVLIGDTNSANLLFDDNEIQARNNATATALILNEHGGNVGIGSNGPTERLDVAGNIRASGTIRSGSSVTIDGTPGSERIVSSASLDLQTATGRALRLEGSPSSPNVIGGFNGNSVTSGAWGAVIGGGGHAANTNQITDSLCTIAGGFRNQAGDNAGTTADKGGAAVGGGALNTAAGVFSVVGGGSSNTASGDISVVPGGFVNQAGGYASLAAGRRAKVRSAADVGGGDTDGDQGTFVWADTTEADFTSTGPNQFLVRASGGVGIGTTAPEGELHVRGDDTLGELIVTPGVANAIAQVRLTENTSASLGAIMRYDGASFNEWQVLGLSSNGEEGPHLVVRRDEPSRVGIGRTSPAHPLHVGTDATNGNGAHVTVAGVWTDASSREFKENFTKLDRLAMLESVAELPVTRWNYKGESEKTIHIGPVAEDFHATFETGQDDQYLAALDTAGVALAAIQGLYEVVKEKDCEIEELEARLARLEALLENVSANKGEGR